MILLPAIDLIEGSAVRLYKGDYNQKVVYSTKPVEVALKYKNAGANYIHLVDLDGAKAGEPKNFEVVADIIKECGLKAEIGGGIRSLDTVESYLSCGAYRVILGTAALQNEELLTNAISEFGARIAIGVDIRDRMVAIKGWTETSKVSLDEFMKKLERLKVDNVICTDISKDGAMSGTNRELYKELSSNYSIKITASGGVSSLDDVAALNKIGVYGAILGKALFTGELKLDEALKITRTNI